MRLIERFVQIHVFKLASSVSMKHSTLIHIIPRQLASIFEDADWFIDRINQYLPPHLFEYNPTFHFGAATWDQHFAG